MNFDLYSASLVYWPLKESRTNIHTLMAEAAHQEQIGVRYLAQGQVNVQLGEPGIQTSSQSTTEWMYRVEF